LLQVIMLTACQKVRLKEAEAEEVKFPPVLTTPAPVSGLHLGSI
jgi:hypothetical protein